MYRAISTAEDFTTYLYNKAEEMKKRAESIQQRVHNDELKACPFKPYLYKPPRKINPSYRGVVGHAGKITEHNSFYLSSANGGSSSASNDISPSRSSIIKPQSIDTPGSVQRKLDEILLLSKNSEKFDLTLAPSSGDSKSTGGYSPESFADVKYSNSLEEIRELGTYQGSLERRNSSSIEKMSPDGRRGSRLDFERRLSQESFNILAHNISCELELEEIDTETMTVVLEEDRPQSRSSSGGSEIDSRSIPFETYQNIIDLSKGTDAG